MRQSEAIKYYSKLEICSFIAKVSQNREVAVQLQGGHYSKRPQIIQFPQDITSFAQEGGTSFHISQERWSDPLKLSSEITPAEMEKIRIGWDFIIDIDCPDFKISTLAAEAIIEFFNEYNINPQIKFSGNKGWHICIPFEAFPSGSEKEFPHLSDTLIKFVNEKIKPIFRKKLSECNFDLGKFLEENNLEKKDYMEKEEINLQKLLGLDIQLASPRHLIRAPYSLHEKSGLVSKVISPKEIKNFKKEDAHPKKIEKVNEHFMNGEKFAGEEMIEIITEAKDMQFKTKKNQETSSTEKRKFIEYKDRIPEEFFPPCIKNIFEGLRDGKKRALFILLNFLQKAKWTWPEIEAKIEKWNKKNAEPLKKGYITSQINWHKNQNKTSPPPNCNLEQYYKDIGICTPDNFCKKIKNPISYPKIKRRFGRKEKESKF